LLQDRRRARKGRMRQRTQPLRSPVGDENGWPCETLVAAIIVETSPKPEHDSAARLSSVGSCRLRKGGHAMSLQQRQISNRRRAARLAIIALAASTVWVSAQDPGRSTYTADPPRKMMISRSEEHTSELQS